MYTGRKLDALTDRQEKKKMEYFTSFCKVAMSHLFLLAKKYDTASHDIELSTISYSTLQPRFAGTLTVWFNEPRALTRGR